MQLLQLVLLAEVQLAIPNAKCESTMRAVYCASCF